MTENADSFSHLLSKSAFKAVITKRNNNSYIINNAKTYHYLRCPNENYNEKSKYQFININQPILNNNKEYDDFNIELKYDSESIRKYKKINKLRKQEKEESSKLIKLKKKRKEYIRNKLLELSVNIEKINLYSSKSEMIKKERTPVVKILIEEKSQESENEKKEQIESQLQLDTNKRDSTSHTSLINSKNNETSKSISLPKVNNKVLGKILYYFK